MKLDELKKLLVGLKPDTEIILNCDNEGGSYRKLTGVEVGKSEEGTALDEQVKGITNKKVVILF